MKSGARTHQYVHRGRTKYELADYAGAIKDHNEAIKVRPDNIDAFNNFFDVFNNLFDNFCQTFQKLWNSCSQNCAT